MRKKKLQGEEELRRKKQLEEEAKRKALEDARRKEEELRRLKLEKEASPLSEAMNNSSLVKLSTKESHPELATNTHH